MKWSDEASFLIVEFGMPRNTTRVSRRTRAIESRGEPRFSLRIPLQVQKTSWNKIRRKVAGRVMFMFWWFGRRIRCWLRLPWRNAGVKPVCRERRLGSESAARKAQLVSCQGCFK